MTRADKTYRINEIFYSVQGEGVRAGTPNVFVRFSGCNLRCSVDPGEKSPGGFDCDTEFESGRDMTALEIAQECVDLYTANPEFVGGWQILTGGEPALQVDADYITCMREHGWKLAIETNGSKRLPMSVEGECLWEANCNEANGALTFQDLIQAGHIARSSFDFDWITVSPKVAEHAIRQPFADEVKYVRGFGQSLPRPACAARHQLISPAFDGLEADEKTLRWCIDLVKHNPEWRLSVQQHKAWRVR